MYKPNKRHLQPLLISNVNDLPEKRRKRLEESWAGVFYRQFFSRLNEEPFAVLYADCPSRPNVPVNWLVALEVLKGGYGWSDEELYDHFNFDLQVRYALGLHDFHEGDFGLRTLYYFRERLSRYNLQHGTNLLVKAFEQITDQQLVAFAVKTGMQRMDSTQIASNIMDMSRLQLLVGALQRVYHMLSEGDQQQHAEAFAPYLKVHSGQYVYRIKGQQATYKHLQQIGELMHRLITELQKGYGQESTYQVLVRLFDDNFQLEETQVQTKTNQELEAGCLQSVNDLEATYRKKGKRSYKGYVANLSETCDPQNELQLITMVQVEPNNTNDNELLVAALPDLKERTGVKTLYTDGPYAGPDVDQALQQHQVTQIQTGINGKTPDPSKFHLADFEIQLDENGVPTSLTCPKEQVVPIQLSSRKRGYRADFDPQVCQACPFHLEGRCPAQPGKKRASFRLTFLPAQLAVAQRRRGMLANKQTGKNPRAAIEGTVREVKHPYPAGKLPVRGQFRMACVIVGSTAMTNIRRIHHHLVEEMKAEKQAETADRVTEGTQVQQNFSVFALLQTIWLCRKLFVSSVSCFGF